MNSSNKNWPGIELNSFGWGFFRIPGDGQGQSSVVQVQRIGVPAVDKRIVHAQIAVAHHIILNRDRACEPGGAVCQPVRALRRVRGNRDGKVGGSADHAQIVEQRRCAVRLRQVEIDRGAVKRGHDGSFGQLHVSAEDCSVINVHFASGCDTHILRTSGA